MTALLEPFAYGYMVNAMWVSTLVGAVCAFLSAYLMLKGWSLIGDALSHSVVQLKTRAETLQYAFDRLIADMMMTRYSDTPHLAPAIPNSTAA